MTSKNRNIHNSVWNVIDVSFYPVVFLATTPYFINRLGEQVFGLWILLNSLLIAFQVFNFGLATATVKYIAHYKSLQQYQRVKAVINTNLSLSLLLFAITIVLGFFISRAVQFNNLFNLPIAIKPLGGTAIKITSLVIGLKFSEQIFLNTFKGFERYDIYTKINALIRFGILGVNVIQVYMGQSLVAMLSANLIVTVTMLVVQYLVLKRIFSQYRLGLLLRKSLILQIGRFGLLTWLQSVIVIIVFQIDRYFVVTYYGPEQLVYYGITATIFVNIHSCLTAGATWLIPKMVHYKAYEMDSTELYRAMRAFITMFSIGALSLFYMVHKVLFTLWIGHEKFEQIREFVKLFTIFELFYMLIIVPPLYANYSGKEKLGTIIIYITSLLNIAGILSGFFIFHSIKGILYGLILSTIVADIIVYSLINKFLLKKNIFIEVFLFVGFSLMGTMIVFSDNIVIQACIILFMIYVFNLFFVKKEKFRLKVLFE